MPAIDPDDDTARRWVIHHFRFDPERNQRRYVFVAAFDNEREYRAAIVRASDEVTAEIAAGTRDPRENISGLVMEPGHLAAAARGHKIRRAMEHGVIPAGLLSAGPLPTNMSVIQVLDEQAD